MGAPKGSKNAKAYHDAKTKERVEQINTVLKAIVNSGFTVTNLTALSQYVAGQIGTSAVTLRRNQTYRQMLERHLVTQRGATKVLSDRDRQITTLRAKLKTASLEISNLKADKDRLEKAINLVSGSAALPASEQASRIKASDSGLNNDFVATATLVMALLDHIDGLGIDEKKEVIIDRVALPKDQVIAGPNICRPFVKWFKTSGRYRSS